MLHPFNYDHIPKGETPWYWLLGPEISEQLMMQAREDIKNKLHLEDRSQDYYYHLVKNREEKKKKEKSYVQKKEENRLMGI